MPSRPGPRPSSPPRGPQLRSALTWGVVDVVLLLVFAASGRRTHEHGVTVLGTLETAWPFLAAYAVAALLLFTRRSPSALWPTAVVLWLATVSEGLALRAVSGAGVALSFQLVTLLVVGAFLVVPRAGARAIRRRRLPVA